MAEEQAAQEEKKPVMAAVKSMTEERDKQLVAKLEEFVKLAKEGHLSDIAIICKVRGEPMTEFEWESDDPLSLLGSLELAKQEVALDMLGEAEGDDEDDEDED
jgi:hypothetical protein